MIVAKDYKLKGYEDTTQLLYTASAQCEMNCLNVDELSMRKILKHGIIVVQKSELHTTPKKYVVEYFISKIAYSLTVSPAQRALRVLSLKRLNQRINCACNE